jgi:hypothetical protein
MSYDPRQMQAIGRMGLGMMAPEPSPFQRQQPQRAPEWWEQPLPGRSGGAQSPQPDDGQSASQSANSPKQPPSLLQMLMLGGKPTYSGMPGGAGWGGPGVK